MEWEDSYYIHRTLCDVLKDMRTCSKTKNYAPLDSLIEEAQMMGNRMEAGLDEQKDLVTMNKEWSELRKKIKIARVELKEVVGGQDD